MSETKKNGRSRSKNKDKELSMTEVRRAADSVSARLASREPALMKMLREMREKNLPPRTRGFVDWLDLPKLAYPNGGYEQCPARDDA